MNSELNPYTPAAGIRPSEPAGRDTIIEQARIALARTRAGRHAKGQILLGQRGVGKTALLKRIEEPADQEGYRTVFIEASEGQRLAELLIPRLRRLLVETTDSDDIEVDLAELFVALGRAAREAETAVVLIIDDMHYLSLEDLSALIAAIHRVSQQALPVILFGAGLSELAGMAGTARSYAERLFDYSPVGSPA